VTIPTIFIPICDQNLWILKIYSHLFKKFWGDEQPVVVLGFGKPDFELPKNFTFVSLAEKQEGGASKWTRYLYNYFSSIEDEHVIFTLEDFFPIQKPNIEVLNSLYSFAKKHDIGRCDITWDSYVNIFDKNNIATRSKSYKVLAKNDDFVILDIPKNAPYRISTQPSIWQRQYLLNFLNNDWSPWDFEIRGTHESSKSDKKIIAIADSTFVNYPTKWIHKGAVSRYHEGKINVLGLDIKTIKELIDLDLVQQENLQWGQWNGSVPTFDELGGFDFHPVKMPAHEASATNWKEYQNIYNPDKEIVNLFDNTFSHTKDLWGYITATGVKMWGKPQKIEFIKNKMNYDGITFFVDDYISNINLVKAVNSKYKVAWLLEPKELKPNPYMAVEHHSDEFDLVITHDSQLIQRFKNCKHIQQAECRVAHEDWGIHKKDKMVSLIAANKKMMEGHRFRFTVAEKLHAKHNFDLYGAAFNNRFENKTDALKDYYFSITIHNTIQDNFFTDGIVDCFALGTIPIFRGCPNIGKFFNKDGIICFNTIDELDVILTNLTEKDYYDRIEAVKENYEISKRFKRTNEDQIIDDVLTYLTNLEKEQ
tara:strand:+ start:24128 stop:25903 length:1776 start_codon:yes stop_codon:yes gene_type:complete